MGLISYYKEQVRVTRERDPAIHSAWEVLLYPGVRAIGYHRVAHKLYKSGHFFLARWVAQRAERDSLSITARVSSSVRQP